MLVIRHLIYRVIAGVENVAFEVIVGLRFLFGMELELRYITFRNLIALTRKDPFFLHGEIIDLKENAD